MVLHNDAGREAELLMRAIATQKTTFDEAYTKSKARPQVEETKATLGDLGIEPDDGVPPSAPTNIIVTALMRALTVSWPLAPKKDHVRTTVVTLTGPGGNSKSYRFRHVDGAAYLDQLNEGTNPLQYTVRVSHIDEYGKQGAATNPITATPSKSTSDYLVADKIETGILKALVSVASSGSISAAGASMNAAGLELSEVASDLGAPSSSSGSKITPRPTGGDLSPFAAFGFFQLRAAQTSSIPRRGIHQRVDGDASFTRGQYRLDITGNGSLLGVKNALMLIQGGLDGTESETFLQFLPHVKIGPGSTDTGVALRVTGKVRFDTNSLNGGAIELNTITGGEIAPQSLAAVHFPGVDGVNVLPANVTVRYSNLTDDIVDLRVLKASDVDSRYRRNSVQLAAPDYGDLSIGGLKIIDQAIGISKINNSLNGGPQNQYALRLIGSSLLGGNAGSAAAADHSHGSGNSLDFDYLSQDHKERVFAARTRLREKRHRIDEMEVAELREVLADTAYIALNTLAIEIDAPDLRAEERHEMYQRGEEFGEFFEYRRYEQIEKEKKMIERAAAMGKGTRREHPHERLHVPHLRHYSKGHPDA